MKISLVQLNSDIHNDERDNEHLHYLQAAAEQNCDIICFPECSLTGYSPENVEEISMSAQDEKLLEINRFATKHKLNILIGISEKTPIGYYISHKIFTASGEEFTHRKAHLGEKEKQYYLQGDILQGFPLPNLPKIGILLCIESHIAPAAEKLSRDGCELIFSPFAMSKSTVNREAIWKKYIPARAYDNRVLYCCCNTLPAGGLLAYSPNGELIAQYYQSHEHMITFEYTQEDISQYRKIHGGKSKKFYPSISRPHLYK